MKRCLGYFLLVVMMCGMVAYYNIGDADFVVSTLLANLPRDYSKVFRTEFDSSEMAWWRQVLCRGSSNEGGRQYELPWLQRDVTPKESDRNIFLVETGCKTTPGFRAYCAVESWSRQNPSFQVWYVMTSLTVNTTDGLALRLQEEYQNMRLVGADVEALFNQTDLKHLFAAGQWVKHSRWPAVHLSDMLRVVLVWLWGGFYTDTDTVCIKEISPLRNIISFNNRKKKVVSNGAFHFQPHHRFLELLMEVQNGSYQAGNWASIGPDAVTRVSKKLCNVTDLQTLSSKTKDRVTCGNFSILPQEYVLPLDWTQNKKLFQKGSGTDFFTRFNSSYVIHLFGALTKKLKVHVGDNSVYEVAAKTFCPITFQHATANNATF